MCVCVCDGHNNRLAHNKFIGRKVQTEASKSLPSPPLPSPPLPQVRDKLPHLKAIVQYSKEVTEKEEGLVDVSHHDVIFLKET